MQVFLSSLDKKMKKNYRNIFLFKKKAVPLPPEMCAYRVNMFYNINNSTN